MVKSALNYQTTRHHITYDSKLQRLWCFNDHKPTFWVILKWILKKSVLESVVWIDLNLDGNKWRALVSRVMNLRVLQCGAEFLD